MNTINSFLIVCLLLLNCKKSTDPNKFANNNVILNDTEEITTSVYKAHKNAEIVFCLDATGSMSGLIGTAKEKIWNIVSELAQSNDIDTLKMGMIFYRDRGDNFVTKKISLTTDLDEAYSELLDVNADGGGDTPESVNQALNEAITALKWSTDKNTYRTIFVVGDCPPHMDYQDDIKYTESCKIAAEKNIIINTIKLGNDCTDAIYHFKKMSSCTNGEYLQLDQNAKDYTIATPYDDEINEISKSIDDSRMYYGSEQERTQNYAKKAKSMEVYDKGTSTANSSRAEFRNSKTGKKGAYGTKEIIKDYEDGKLKIESISEDKLPKDLKGKNILEKETIIRNLVKKRKDDNARLIDLIKKKNRYIKSKESIQKDSTSFSKEVAKIMTKQSKN